MPAESFLAEHGAFSAQTGKSFPSIRPERGGAPLLGDGGNKMRSMRTVAKSKPNSSKAIVINHGRLGDASLKMFKVLQFYGNQANYRCKCSDPECTANSAIRRDGGERASNLLAHILDYPSSSPGDQNPGIRPAETATKA
jgi:hypothetical protein